MSPSADYTHTGGGYGGMSKGTDWHRGNETTCFTDSGNYTSTLIVPEANDFLQRMAKAPEKKPFFLYLPFHLVSMHAACTLARSLYGHYT
eukprot:COSAG05_NODE_4163_length_1646_cov_17.789270_2_plen_90_part_00